MAGGTTQPKVTGHQPSNPWKFHLNSPNQSKVNQHFPKHGSTLTTWPRYPEGSLKSKNKNSGLLKSNFKRATFYQKNCQILKYICAPWGPYPENPVIRPWPQNQKSTLPWLFGLKTAFQNVWHNPVAPTTTDLLYPGGTVEEYYPPNLASLESYIQIRSTVQNYSWFPISWLTCCWPFNIIACDAALTSVAWRCSIL